MTSVPAKTSAKTKVLFFDVVVCFGGVFFKFYFHLGWVFSFGFIFVSVVVFNQFVSI